MFLTGLFTQGLGLSILQTAVNPYVTIIGPIESAAKRISLMGICNKVAGAVGSIVLGKILLDPLRQINADIESAAFDKTQLLNNLAHRIVMPYTILTIVLVLVAIFIRFSPLPDVKEEAGNTTTKSAIARPLESYTYLWLGALAIFMYVGVEVLAGDYIINFGHLPRRAGGIRKNI